MAGSSWSRGGQLSGTGGSGLGGAAARGASVSGGTGTWGDAPTANGAPQTSEQLYEILPFLSLRISGHTYL